MIHQGTLINDAYAPSLHIGDPWKNVLGRARTRLSLNLQPALFVARGLRFVHKNLSVNVGIPGVARAPPRVGPHMRTIEAHHGVYGYGALLGALASVPAGQYNPGCQPFQIPFPG